MLKTKRTKPSDVAEVLEDLGVEIARSGDREISAHCPFHADRHPSFSMRATSGVWICFQCGERGTLSQLVIRLRSDVKVETYLREVKYERLRKVRPKKDAEPEVVPETPLLIFARYDSFRAPPDWAIEERFITRTAAEELGIKWDKGWILPVWNPNGRLGFEDLWGWQFKRLDWVSNHPPGITKASTLFGFEYVEPGDRVVLVESPLDVARLASVGLIAVASFGAYVSNVQLKLLMERAGSVVLALDGDIEGRVQARRIRPQLMRCMPTTMIRRYPKGAKDPGDLTDEQALELLA